MHYFKTLPFVALAAPLLVVAQADDLAGTASTKPVAAPSKACNSSGGVPNRPIPSGPSMPPGTGGPGMISVTATPSGSSSSAGSMATSSATTATYSGAAVPIKPWYFGRSAPSRAVDRPPQKPSDKPLKPALPPAGRPPVPSGDAEKPGDKIAAPSGGPAHGHPPAPSGDAKGPAAPSGGPSAPEVTASVHPAPTV